MGRRGKGAAQNRAEQSKLGKERRKISNLERTAEKKTGMKLVRKQREREQIFLKAGENVTNSKKGRREKERKDKKWAREIKIQWKEGNNKYQTKLKKEK